MGPTIASTVFLPFLQLFQLLVAAPILSPAPRTRRAAGSRMRPGGMWKIAQLRSPPAPFFRSLPPLPYILVERRPLVARR